MKNRILLLLAFILPAWALAQSPCTTTNASGCICEQQGQIDCDLLPDITVSGWAVLNYSGGPSEYSQSGNGANDGRLRVTGSTPNIGLGSFTVGSVQQWVCGQDTFSDYNTALTFCAVPQQLIKQKIYHKNGNSMSFSERWAGTMTYHPTHGHMHVDDWATFTLRIEDQNEPNPLNWPIVGDGSKLGFCLMDYGSCTTYNGHCRDSSNNILVNTSFPNYGLGGMQYNCSPVEQGISSGWTDIYSENLDGMWIDIPPGTCNGDYYIVMEVDPNNNFVESREDNNWAAVPFTLTKQTPMGQFVADISPSGPTNICAGDAVTLAATMGTGYLWSNGDTTQTITVNSAGTYTCTVTAACGTDATDPVTVTVSNTTTAPTGTGDLVCTNSQATLTANGSGDFNWYDAAVGGTLMGTGNTFVTPMLATTTDFYVEKVETGASQLGYAGPVDGAFGAGAYHQNNTRYLTFDASSAFTLKSVWVDAGATGNRTIELRDAAGTTVIASVSQFVPAGTSQVTLNFAVPMGTNMQLGLEGASMSDLYRNNTGVVYPYGYSNVVSITGSSAGAQYYYFFYKWEIEVPGLSCSSPRAAITASVSAGPTVSFTGLASSYMDTDPASSLVGTPAGGTFSGPGVSGNSFDPAVAGPGTHTIMYSYQDVSGCEANSSISTTVNSLTAIDGNKFSVEPVVYPNPHNGRYTLAFDLVGLHNVDMKVFNLSGQMIFERDLGPMDGQFRQEFEMGTLAKGIYFLELEVDGEKFRTKMAYQ